MHGDSDQESEQIAGGLVGPLDVFDHEDDRRGPGKPLDDAEHEFEQSRLAIPVELWIIGAVPRTARRAPAAVGQVQTVGAEDRREPPRSTDRRVREDPRRRAHTDATATELKARARDDMSAALRRSRREALDERRLADAGLATDETVLATPSRAADSASSRRASSRRAR